jgi:PadR family transcriptional regulator, regulatory protein PadR
VHEEQLLKGALDIVVLAAIRRSESYGYELVQRIRESGPGLERVAEPSVYGTLRRLEAQKLVRSRLVRSTQGPARRYYDLTADGSDALDAMISSWTEVTKAVDALVQPGRGRKR